MHSLKFIPEGPDGDKLLEKSQVKLVSNIPVRRGKNVYYTVQCLHCNRVFEKTSHKFGISQCQCLKKRNGAYNYEGKGDIGATYFHRVQVNAGLRKLPFEITAIDMWDKYIEQDKKCALTGLSIHIERNYMKKRSNMTASLDRIDNSKAYTIDNIQWVHKDINLMKNKFSEEYFIKMCKLIIKHNGRKNK